MFTARISRSRMLHVLIVSIFLIVEGFSYGYRLLWQSFRNNYSIHPYVDDFHSSGVWANITSRSSNWPLLWTSISNIIRLDSIESLCLILTIIDLKLTKANRKFDYFFKSKTNEDIFVWFSETWCENHESYLVCS